MKRFKKNALLVSPSLSFIFSILIASLSLMQTALADKLTVCPSRCDYETIQMAIDAANHGDSVILFSGLYEENIEITKSLRLKGAGPSRTVITRAPGFLRAPVVSLQCSIGVSDITISSLTITGGRARSYGGGLYNEGCNAILKNTAVINNESGGHHYAVGGGIYNSAGKLVLRSSHVSNNRSLAGHGGARGGGIFNDRGVIDMKNSFVMNNSINGAGHNTHGSGIANHGGSLSLINSAIANNKTDLGRGGGISNLSGGTVSMRNSTMANNSAPRGGAIVIEDGTVSLPNSHITHNTASGDGGGIYIEASGSLGMLKALVRNNSADTSGTGGTGGGLYSDIGATVSARSSLIKDNTPDNCAGGGFACP